MGCLWAGDHLVSLSLSGDLNFLDPRCPEKPCRVYSGHQKGITAFALSSDRKTIFTGSYDGRVCSWNGLDGNGHIFGHQNAKVASSAAQIVGLSVNDQVLTSVGMDDCVRFAELSGHAFGSVIICVLDVDCWCRINSVSCSAQPRDLNSVKDLSAIVTANQLILLRGICITRSNSFKPFNFLYTVHSICTCPTTNFRRGKSFHDAIVLQRQLMRNLPVQVAHCRGK